RSARTGATVSRRTSSRNVLQVSRKSSGVARNALFVAISGMSALRPFFDCLKVSTGGIVSASRRKNGSGSRSSTTTCGNGSRATSAASTLALIPACMPSAPTGARCYQPSWATKLGGQRRRHPLARVGGPRRDDARPSLEVERCGAERRRVRELDRVPALADEQLRGGDVDRPGGLERADRVDPAVGELAERDRERAEDPQAVDDPDERRRVARHEIGARRLER